MIFLLTMKGMYSHLTSQVAQLIKNPPASAGDRRQETGDTGSIPGLGRSPGVGNGNPLQCTCQESSMDRVWRATVHRASESDAAVCVRVCTPTPPHTHRRTPPQTHIHLPRSNCM